VDVKGSALRRWIREERAQRNAAEFEGAAAECVLPSGVRLADYLQPGHDGRVVGVSWPPEDTVWPPMWFSRLSSFGGLPPVTIMWEFVWYDYRGPISHWIT